MPPQAFLAFAGAFGGGVLAIEAYRGLSSGKWVEEPAEPEREQTDSAAAGNFVALNVGVLLLAGATRDIVKQYGVKNVVLGSLAATGFAFLLKTLAGK